MAHHDTAPTDLSWADGLQPDWPAPVGVHAFFTTRSGGCSAAPFDRLNLGDHVGDQVQAVQTNRRALQVLLRSVTPEARAVFLRQVHGCAAGRTRWHTSRCLLHQHARQRLHHHGG